MGAAMLAGVATGTLASLPEAAARWVRLGRRFEPVPALASHYDRRLRRYEDLLGRLNDWAAA
jgi:sugar (pentulose or hexulose) kinase